MTCKQCEHFLVCSKREKLSRLFVEMPKGYTAAAEILCDGFERENTDEILLMAHDEAVEDFAHFLIDKAKDGVIQVRDLPDLVIEWGEAPSGSDADSSSMKEDWLMQRFTKTE